MRPSLSCNDCADRLILECRHHPHHPEGSSDEDRSLVDRLFIRGYGFCDLWTQYSQHDGVILQPIDPDELKVSLGRFISDIEEWGALCRYEGRTLRVLFKRKGGDTYSSSIGIPINPEVARLRVNEQMRRAYFMAMR
jgi:hypothetical protein